MSAIISELRSEARRVRQLHHRPTQKLAIKDALVRARKALKEKGGVEEESLFPEEVSENIATNLIECKKRDEMKSLNVGGNSNGPKFSDSAPTVEPLHQLTSVLFTTDEQTDRPTDSSSSEI